MTNAEIKIPVTKTTRANPPPPFFKGGDTGITKGRKYRASNDSVSFNLIGQNPAQADALSVLCKDGSPFASAGLGFTANFLAAVAYQESRLAQFTSIQHCSPSPLNPLTDTDGYPVQACDNGYGIMQLTQGVPGGLNYHQGRYTDTPTQDMIWNWVANINAGENVMLEKLQWARMYSSQDYQWMRYPQYIGCNFLPMTPDQLQMETWQAYNGGSYYVVDNSNYPLSCGWVKNPVLTQKQYVKCTINSVGYPYADCVNNIAEQHPNDWCK